MRRVAGALAATAMLGACGDGTEETGQAPSRPTGAGDVVVQVTVAGGFLPVEVAVATVPTVTVLGDGTVITPAPVLAIYPGPAIAPLQAASAGAAAVDGLVRRAAELGLLAGPLEFGRPPVADAPETTVTVVSGGREHTQVAYALGMGDIPGGGQGGLGQAELANRRALSDFVAATGQLPPGGRPWVPSAVAVYALGDYRADPQLPQRPAGWPLPAEPAVAGGNFPCTLYEGADAEALVRALASANALTPWTVGGRARSLAFRPVVPGQPGCPA